MSLKNRLFVLKIFFIFFSHFFLLLCLKIGVFFTKYAKDVCENLNLKGWIRVSPRGSIYGQIQGEKDKVDEM